MEVVVKQLRALVVLFLAGAAAWALISVVGNPNQDYGKSNPNGGRPKSNDVSITFSVVRAKNIGTAYISYSADGTGDQGIELISINWHKTVLVRHGAVLWLEVNQATGPVTIDMFIMNKSVVLEHGVHPHLNAMRIYAQAP